MDNSEIDELEIGPEEVETLLGKDHPTIELLDVREDWELTRGMLPEAVHIPMSQLAEYEVQWDANRQYIVYCEHGIRSLDVVLWLAQNKGIKAKSMRGGFAEWHGEVVSNGSGGQT